MLKKQGLTDSKQKTLSCFLEVPKTNMQTKCSENKNKRSLRRPGLVYLESSSDEDDVNQKYYQGKLSPDSESFVPSPRKYKFSSIDAIIREDKNYQNAMDKIDKCIGTTQIKPKVKTAKELSTFLNDSISPIKSQQAESLLMAKYLGELNNEGTSNSNVKKTCFDYQIQSEHKLAPEVLNSFTANDSQETICSEDLVLPEDQTTKKAQKSVENISEDVSEYGSCKSKKSINNKDIIENCMSASNKEHFKFVFEPNLEEYLCDLLRRDEFKIDKTGDHIEHLQKRLNFVDESYLELSEKMCEIVDQIPYIKFKDIPGFNTCAFLKLKTVRQQVKAKRKILHRIYKNSKENIAFQDEHVYNVDIERKLIPNTTESINNSFKNIEDDNDLEELLDEIKKQEITDKGHSRFDNMTYNNLESTSTHINTDILKKPRIQFMSNNSTPQIDDDGWEIYDEKQFENDTLNNNKNYKILRANSADSSKSSGSQQVKGRFHANVQNDGITGEFDGDNYPFTKEVFLVLKNSFGLSSFRPNQYQIINAALSGLDTFVLMPTGGGKSLCYQLPAVLSTSKGITIVVSPLKSLIFDQVSKLESLGIVSKHLSGDISVAEANSVYTDLGTDCPLIRILYVTPEKISSSPKFQDYLDLLYEKDLISRFVIDEAHCVSQWGHDFRPDYKKLAILRKRFKKVPLMALTASATPRVRSDILQQLGIIKCKWFLSSFNRINLKYVVVPKTSNTVDDIVTFIKCRYSSASGIIYCLSRKECEEISQQLSKKSIKSAPYHAGLSDHVRESVQKDWITNKFKVICATIAFGMGIDKPDVRYVLHYSLPKSIEGYYQESGRAGRDGEIAHCILYYSYRDMIRMRKIMDLEKSKDFTAKQVHITNLNRIVGFCENIHECRRTLQLEYFGEHFTSEECLQNSETACDNCLRRKDVKMLDITTECKKIVECVREICGNRNRFTLLYITDVLKGSSIKKILDNNHNNVRFWGCLKAWDKSEIERILRKLVVEEYLREDLIFSKDIPQAYLYLGQNINKLMNLNSNVKIEFGVKSNSKALKSLKATTAPQLESAKSDKNKGLNDLQINCYHELLDLCRKLSLEKNINLASIMNIQALKSMSEIMPETEEEFKKIPHVTNTNYQKYGEDLLTITKTYAAQKKFLIDDKSIDESDEYLMEVDLSGVYNNHSVDWDQEAFVVKENSTKNTGNRARASRSGFKRKRTYRNSKSKKSKANTPKKTGGSWSSTRGTQKGNRRAHTSSSNSYNLLPVPGSSKISF